MCMRRFGQASGEPWCARRVSARIIVSPTEETELRQAFRISRPQRAESFPSGPAGGLPSGSRLEKAKKAVGYHTTDRRGRSRAGNRSSFAGISTGAGRSRGTPRSVFPSATGRHSCQSEEHTSELQSPDQLVSRLLLEKKKSSSANQIFYTINRQ